MTKIAPAKFFREVKQEAKKVTWPTRSDTVKASIFVFIMVGIAAVFFLIVDWILSNSVQLLLGI